MQRNKVTVETADMIRSVGIEVEIVSAGSTGTYEVTGTYPGITEIQPGRSSSGSALKGQDTGSDPLTTFSSSLLFQSLPRLLAATSRTESSPTQGRK